MDKLCSKILDEYKKLAGVEAIAIGGSSAAKTSDNVSDIDIYVFTTESIPVEVRESIIKKYSSIYEAGGEYFGAGDEYYVDELKVQFDVMFWDKAWFNSVYENVWVKHYPSNGYTTCFLYTLNNFNIVYDKNNWLNDLKKELSKPYPIALQKNIIKRNMMLMTDKPFASYYEQIEKALKRNDIVSVNHRIAAFLASYFDVIFAINKTFHPGEKRLIQFAKTHCQLLPEDFEKDITNLLKQPNLDTLNILKEMVDKLKNLHNTIEI